jgi:TetR/AcrR family transcriptional regulator, ethionamide resistance regulator
MATEAKQSGAPRRSREEVEEAVMKATLELTEKLPFKDLTVDRIARAGGISRTAFYFYFRDKHEVLRGAMEEATEEAFHEADRWWHGEGDPRSLIRTAVQGVVDVYRRHEHLMRVVQEVSTYDAEMGELWRDMIGRFIRATAEHLQREKAAGRLRPLDPDAAAESLVWMTERCNYMYLSLGRRTPEDEVEALTEIWYHALYPDDL